MANDGVELTLLEAEEATRPKEEQEWCYASYATGLLIW